MGMNALRQALIKAIENTDYQQNTYFAGGCVRDFCMQRETKDYDLCVELEQGGINLAKHLHQLGIVTKPIIYRRFGTAMVRWQGIHLELIQTRKDSLRALNDDEAPSLGTITEDVMRRDFTMNSLLMRVADGAIIDLTCKGLGDIQNCTIRTVCAPEIVFGDDPLRLLRAVRFACELGFTVEASTWNALCEFSDSILTVSWERIPGEMRRIILSEQPALGVELLLSSNLMHHISPLISEAYTIFEKNYGNPALHSMLSVMDMSPPEIVIRWTALLQAIPMVDMPISRVKADRDASTRSKLPHMQISVTLRKYRIHPKFIRDIHKLLSCLRIVTQAFSRNKEISARTLRSIVLNTQEMPDTFIMLLELNSKAHLPYYPEPEQVANLIQRLRFHQQELNTQGFELTGNDIIESFGYAKGPIIGSLLRRARHKWLGDPGLSKAALLAYLKNNKTPS